MDKSQKIEKSRGKWRRKKVKVALLIVLIFTALAIAALYLFYSKSNASTVPIPTLYTDGPYIKRSDNQSVVKLRGVASLLYYSRRTSPFTSTLEVLINELPDWPFNVIRVSYDAAEIVEFYQYQDLDKLINYTQARGMYVILDPRSIDYETPSLPDDTVDTSLRFLAERYKHKTHILYGLWSQPGDTTWEQWASRALDLATVVRETNPNAVLVVTGTNWSKDFTYLKNNPFPFDNAIYDVRDFYRPERDTRKDWIWMVKKLPVLIGAFRGAYSNNLEDCDYLSDCDLNYVRESLSIVNNNSSMVHYTFETLDLLNTNNNLTILGRILSDDLENNPPTVIYTQEDQNKRFTDNLKRMFSFL